MIKRKLLLEEIEKEAKNICDTPFRFSFSRQKIIESLRNLENKALKLCEIKDKNGQIIPDNDLNNDEKEILIMGFRISIRLNRIIADYRIYIEQYYTEDMELSEDDTIPLGFHKSYWMERNYQIIEILNHITVFPHYCFSYYDTPLGGLIEEQTDEFPAIYRSSQSFNFGENSFLIILDDFMFFIGWPNTIIKDIKLLVQSAIKHNSLWIGHDMITDLYELPDKIENGDGFYNKLESMRKAYLEIQKEKNYNTIVSAINDYITSIEISPGTKKNIDEYAEGFMKPLCQIPFGLGGYRSILKYEFGYNDNNLAKLKFMNKEHPMFAIMPHIYWHESGVIYDSDRGTVSGTRANILKFLSFLNSHDSLIESDLRYLNMVE